MSSREAEALSRVLADPDSAVWHGPDRVISDLLKARDREIVELEIAGSDGPTTRVDAKIRSGERQEWHVALFLLANWQASEVWVFQRPAPYVPTAGLVVVLNGASGVGKSAVMAAIADQAETPWIVFDEPHVGAVQASYLIWRDVAPSVHVGAFDAIRALAEAGNQVAVAAGGFGFTFVRERLASVRSVVVGLHCSDELRRERLARDPFRRPGTAWNRLAADVHEGWDYDVEFTTDSQPASSLAAELLRLA